MDEELEHICDELDLGMKTRNALEYEEIISIETLMLAKEEFVKNKHINPIVNESYQKLHDIVCWLEKFREENGRDADVMQEFTIEAYMEYGMIIKCISDLKERGILAGKSMQAVLERSPRIYEKVMEEWTETVMTPLLKERCGNFKYKEFIRSTTEHLCPSLKGKEHQKNKLFAVAGQTQAGKSSVKGVVQSICGLLSIPMVVITKGVTESRDLHSKLIEMAEGTAMKKEHVLIGAGRNKERDFIMKRVFSADNANGGNLVIADTYHQINKAINQLMQYTKGDRGKKFILILDECDAFYRTEDRHQKMEQALDELMEMQPFLIIAISATPIPMIIEFDKNWPEYLDPDTCSFFKVEPVSNYVGIEQIKPLKNGGREVFLQQNEISLNTEYSYRSNKEGKLVQIPYANEKLKWLYDDSLSQLETRKGVLLLDCSDPRVYAAGNVREKAERVQEMYGQQGKDIIVIYFVGSGISVKLPGDEFWYEQVQTESKRKTLDEIDNDGENRWLDTPLKTMSKVLDKIDNDEDYGLDVPVFIFGYAKLRRGVSFRSAKRVPTHMAVSLSRRHNLMNTIQTMGRATFVGRNVLERNGFENVTMLTTSSDMTTARKSIKFIDTVHSRCEEGYNILNAMRKEMPDEANFLRHTCRELGARKGLRSRFKEMVSFSEPCDGLDEGEYPLKDKYWNKRRAQQVLLTIFYLLDKHPKIHKGDVQDAFNDNYRGYQCMNKKEENDWLREFSDNAMIMKDKTKEEGREEVTYTNPTKSLKWFSEFINPELSAPDNEPVDLNKILNQTSSMNSLAESESESELETASESNKDSECPPNKRCEGISIPELSAADNEPVDLNKILNQTPPTKSLAENESETASESNKDSECSAIKPWAGISILSGSSESDSNSSDFTLEKGPRRKLFYMMSKVVDSDSDS